jgi:HEAT repeat protein
MDTQTRLRALEGIAQNPSAEYLGVVLTALSDPSIEVKTLAAKCLALLDPDLAFKGLMDLLCANWPDSAAALGESLPLLGSAMKERMFAALQSPEDIGLRKAAAAFALGRMGYRQALVSLMECALQSDDAILAVTSARALYALNDAAALPCYSQLVHHVCPEVRSAALAGLAALAVPQAIEVLGAVATEMDKNLEKEQGYTVELLGKTRHEAAIPVLIDIMKRNLAMRIKAAEALHEMTGLDLGELPSDWEDWYAQRGNLPEDTPFLPGGAWPPPWLDPRLNPKPQANETPVE